MLHYSAIDAGHKYNRVTTENLAQQGQYQLYRVLIKFEGMFQKDAKCIIKHLDFIKLCYFNIERVSYKM